jgi:hypothetical protein
MPSGSSQYECIQVLRATNETKLLRTVANSSPLPRSRFSKPKSVVGIIFFCYFNFIQTVRILLYFIALRMPLFITR